MRFQGQHIWIIGASSGIGKAVAVELAQQGASLILSARNSEALVALKDSLPGKHKVYPLDVADNVAVERVIQEVTNEVNVLDRVIYMAAMYEPEYIANMDLDKASMMLRVNILGAMGVVKGVLPVMETQPYAQIAICASSAGYTGLAGGQPYSATKAALINFTESLAVEVPKHIDVKLINPGFVKTPLTDKNQFAMPMIMEVEDAAKCLIGGLNNNNFEIAFPKKFILLLKLICILPARLQQKVKHKLANRSSEK